MSSTNSFVALFLVQYLIATVGAQTNPNYQQVNTCSNAKQLQKTIDSLQKEANKLKASCLSGELSISHINVKFAPQFHEYECSIDVGGSYFMFRLLHHYIIKKVFGC